MVSHGFAGAFRAQTRGMKGDIDSFSLLHFSTTWRRLRVLTKEW